MHPVATEMCLHVTAGEAAPGALKNAVIRPFFKFFFQKYNHCLLFWSWLPLPVSPSGLASLSVPFPGSYLVYHRNCQLAGLVHLCSGLSCRNAAALETPARRCLLFLLPIICLRGSGPSPLSSSQRHPIAASVCVGPYRLFQGLGTRFCVVFKVGSKQGRPKGCQKCRCLLRIISQDAVSVTSLTVPSHFVCQIHVMFGLPVARSSFKHKEVISLEYWRPEWMF